MTELLIQAIESVQNSHCAFCHYITPNDAGKTGSHQSGFYLPKDAQGIILGDKAKIGCNANIFIKIKWQDGYITNSRIVYYGVGTRNESRITRFGRGFEWLRDEHVGDLLVLAQQDIENYEAWVLSTEEDIDGFLSYYNLSPEDANKIIQKVDGQLPDSELQLPDSELDNMLSYFVEHIKSFPETTVMAQTARDCYNQAFKLNDNKIAAKPDEVLLKWVNTEYTLFRMVEHKLYMPIIGNTFKDVSSFVDFANKVLNRRKSRAGKSLEHHLASVFEASNIIYEEQVVTEEKKRPDFIFPDGQCYHNSNFPEALLVSLAAKTTCKDRWRQVINEANRIPEKHLFTLQPTISKNQLKEMADEKVHLVVPGTYIKNYPQEYRSSIIDLRQFIGFVREKESESRLKHLIV